MLCMDSHASCAVFKHVNFHCAAQMKHKLEGMNDGNTEKQLHFAGMFNAQQQASTLNSSRSSLVRREINSSMLCPGS